MVEQAGIVYVRGCEVEGMLDASGRVIEEGPEPRPELEGDARTFRLLLDPNQYRLDLDHASKGNEVCSNFECFYFCNWAENWNLGRLK